MMQRSRSNWKRAPRWRQRRSGMSSLEVVMTAAVMVPLAVALLIFAIKMCNYLYRIAAAFVGWMFL